MPLSVVDALRDGLKREDAPPVQMRVYEGAGHAFAHRPSSAQDETDSRECLQIAVQWVSRYSPQ